MLILKMVISEEISLKKHIKAFITRSETGILHMSISHLFYNRLQICEHIFYHTSKNKLKKVAVKLCIKHIKVRNRHLTV